MDTSSSSCSSSSDTSSSSFPLDGIQTQTELQILIDNQECSSPGPSIDELEFQFASTRRKKLVLYLLLITLVLVTVGLLLTLLPTAPEQGRKEKEWKEEGKEETGGNQSLRPPFLLVLCDSSPNSADCWPEQTKAPTFESFNPQNLPEGLPRNNHYRFTATGTWISKGITLETAVRMMLGDRTVVFESFLFQTVRAFISGKPLPDPYSWDVSVSFTDTDGIARKTAVNQGISDAQTLSQMLFDKLGLKKGQFVSEDESTEVVKQLLPIFLTKRRLAEFLEAFDLRSSDQPIDMIYSSYYNNQAEQYGNELVIMKPEIEPYRSLDINVYKFYALGQTIPFHRNLGELATAGWVESDQIAGFQFYEDGRKIRPLLFSFNLIEDAELSFPLIAVFDGKRSQGSDSFGILRLPDGRFVYQSQVWDNDGTSPHPDPLTAYNPLEFARPIGFLCVAGEQTPSSCEVSIPPAIMTKYGSSSSCTKSMSKSKRDQLEEMKKSLAQAGLKLNGISRNIHFETLCK